MAQPREKKEQETKEKEVKEQKGLNTAQKEKETKNKAQLEMLKTFIAPIEEKEGSFEELLELAGTDIQTVLDNKNTDFNTQKTCLDRAMRENSKQFDVSLSKLLPSGVNNDELRTSLKRINDFCVDNNIQFLIEGF